MRFDTHDIVPSRVTLVFPILHRPSRRIARALLVATRLVSNHSSRARYSHFTPLPPRVASHPKDEMRYFLYVAMNCATKPSRWMMGFCPSCSLCS